MARPWRKPRVTPDDDPKHREFAGLVNTRSSKDVGLGALTIADNILITDSKKMRVRPGSTLYRAGVMQSAFVVGDSLYTVESGTLKRIVSPTDAHTLQAGLTGLSYSWDEVNGDGYFVNGVEAGIVAGDVVRPLRVSAPTITSVALVDSTAVANTPFNIGDRYVTATWRFCATYETADGRESAPSEVVEVLAPPLARLFSATVPIGYARTNLYVSEPDGTVFRRAATSTIASFTAAPARATRELTTYGTFPLPDGVEQIVYWMGRLYVSQYFAQEDTSVIWCSEPYAFHLYDMGKDYRIVPGRVSMLLWISQDVHNWLLIGSTQGVWQLSEDDRLTNLTTYGVVPGIAGDVTPEGTAYFWTTRGFCKAPEFKNLTEDNVGMPPGLWASTKLVYLEGMQHIVTITQGGGTPFNVRSSQ